MSSADLTARARIRDAGSGALRYSISSAATNTDSKGLKDQLVLTVKTVDATGRITHVGPRATAPPSDAPVTALPGALLPGLVNTHHHLYQTLTRARAQEAARLIETGDPLDAATMARLTADKEGGL